MIYSKSGMYSIVNNIISYLEGCMVAKGVRNSEGDIIKKEYIAVNQESTVRRVCLCRS